VKFVRRLGVVVLVVGVVVLLGLAWGHFGASTLIGNEQGPFHQEVVTGAQAGRFGGPREGVSVPLGLKAMFQSVNLPVLRHTVVIEGLVIALVVVFDLVRRGARRERRARWLAAQEAERLAAQEEERRPNTK
jgi:hypothetical protein